MPLNPNLSGAGSGWNCSVNLIPGRALAIQSGRGGSWFCRKNARPDTAGEAMNPSSKVFRARTSNARPGFRTVVLPFLVEEVESPIGIHG